jgi:hypothetical protein
LRSLHTKPKTKKQKKRKKEKKWFYKSSGIARYCLIKMTMSPRMKADNHVTLAATIMTAVLFRTVENCNAAQEISAPQSVPYTFHKPLTTSVA